MPYIRWAKNHCGCKYLFTPNIERESNILRIISINMRRLTIIVILILCIVALLYHTSLRPRLSSNLILSANSNKMTSSTLWLILTSITQLQQYLLSPQQNMSVILIGDHQHPTLLSNKTNIIVLNSHLQSQLSFRSTNPKLIAYLLAMKHGARYIYEFHSNLSFSYYHDQAIQHVAFRRQRSPFVNIYPTFTANFTDHSPGLPKEELLNITQDGWSSIRTIDPYQETIRALIQQQIFVFYRKKSLFVDHPPVAIEPLTFAPFSSENVLFTYDAFWGLVFFGSKSDTWRSWWVQRLLWDINGHLLFASSGHQTDSKLAPNPSPKENLKEDANVSGLVRYLSTWKSTKSTLVERIEQLIQDLIEKKFCDANDLKTVRAWIDDLKQIKYVFPTIKKASPDQTSSGTVRRRRTAVCLTGRIECIEEAWRPTAQAIRTHIQGEMDIFMYLSSTEPVFDQLSTVPSHNRLVEVLRYSNFTVKVLFEDIPKLDPHFPPQCTTDASVNQPPHKVPRYYQQLFGLSNCFALVRNYEKKHQIKYDLMIRSRGDIVFLKIPSTFDRTSPFDINTTLILPPNRYSSKVDDGFAIGPINALEVYMNRYYSFRECLTRDLHPERYLYFYLNYRKVSTIVDKNIVVGPIPHSRKHCH